MKSADSEGAPKRITLSDVARAVGVSKITVSRAMRDSPLVRADVRQKVRETAEALGYRVNLAARDLRLQQRRRIAVIVEMKVSEERPMYDPFPLALLGGIVQQCAAAGFAVVLATGDPEMAAEARDASGIVVLGQGANHQMVRSLAALELPLVVWGADDGTETTMGVAVVGSDNREGGRLAAAHLLARGARLIFLGDTSHAEVADRLAGFRESIDGKRGAALVDVRSCDFTREGGRSAMEAVLAGGAAFDGIFAQSDLVAIGAMDALNAAGIAWRDRIAVVGYDDSPAAAAHRPQLTSIRQDWTAGGRLLASAMLAQLHPARHRSPESHILPVSLTRRET
ncbi:substrate-binding domain-containing protein [Sphingomonas sp.]|uniref:substrate-binding domain-containing protein n=1 Tax=Sphingomonas sp. TaxID=28214 RepID=UPI001EBC1C10|nr:substrate-binding domain-containing protein [Sphingomonas sp.]MBX3595059.1 substrate-binding domain-containing protein [Sphingomonas sp.]